MLQGKHGKLAIHECQRYYTLGRETEREKVRGRHFSGAFFPDNWTKLRGLRSQKELLRAQHICKSVPLLKCLNRDFDIELTVLCALTLPAAMVDKPKLSPVFEHLHDMSCYLSLTVSSFWSPEDSPSPSARHPTSPQSYLGCWSPAQQSCLWTLSAVLCVCMGQGW